MANFARFERLPYLIIQDIRVPFLFSPCDGFILGFGKHELGFGGFVVALISGDEVAVFGFERIAPVVKTVLHCLRFGFAVVDMARHESCRGDGGYLLM